MRRRRYRAFVRGGFHCLLNLANTVWSGLPRTTCCSRFCTDDGAPVKAAITSHSCTSPSSSSREASPSGGSWAARWLSPSGSLSASRNASGADSTVFHADHARLLQPGPGSTGFARLLEPPRVDAVPAAELPDTGFEGNGKKLWRAR